MTTALTVRRDARMQRKERKAQEAKLEAEQNRVMMDKGLAFLDAQLGRAVDLAKTIMYQPYVPLILANLALEVIEQKGYGKSWGGLARGAINVAPFAQAATSIIGAIK